MPGSTTALIGAAGGAGTTRSAVEFAATLAADGRSVAVIDAAFATQGLAHYVSGRVDPDATALVTDAAEADLSAGLADLDLPVPGRVACCPARAPFERLARAKTAEAARRFEDRIAAAAASFDRVLVDVPPVAANQAVAAVGAADRRTVIAPATTRGADAVERVRDRLADLGFGADAVVSTRGDISAADASIPVAAMRDPDDAPACLADESFAAAVAPATEVAVGCSLSLEFDEDGLVDRVESYVAGN